MTDAELRDAALAKFQIELDHLKRTTRGLKNFTPPPGSEWGQALAARSEGLALIAQIGQVAPPPPPPPPHSGFLTWTPPGYPNYSGYEQYTVTNSVALPTATPGSGRNALVTIGQALTGQLNIKGWNNVVIIGGAFNVPQNVQLNHAIGIYNCTGIVHLEGIDIGKVNTYFDAGIGVSTGPGSVSPGARVQLQNSRVYCGFQGDIGSGTHCDCIQNWNNPGAPAGYGGGARGYRFDRCTFTAGYQAMFLGNHNPGDGTTEPIGDEDSYIHNCNFRAAASVRSVAGPIYFWHTFRVDPWGHHTVIHFQNTHLESFTENSSIIPNKNGGGTTVPGADAADRGYTVKSDADGQYIEWLATSDQQGIIRIGTPPDGDFCPAGVPGMNYISPGYA